MLSSPNHRQHMGDCWIRLYIDKQWDQKDIKAHIHEEKEGKNR